MATTQFGLYVNVVNVSIEKIFASAELCLRLSSNSSSSDEECLGSNTVIKVGKGDIEMHQKFDITSLLKKF